MGEQPLEDSMPREQSLPPHLQSQTSYMRTTSPPIANGAVFQRQGTPQAHIISRPGSRNSVSNVNVRRGSTNLGPSHLQQVSQAPQGPDGYAYMRTPPINHQAAHGMPIAAHHPQQPFPQAQYYNQPHQPATHPQVQQAYLQEQRRQSLPPAFPQHERQQHQQQQQQHVPSPPHPECEQQSQDDQSNRLQQPAPAKSRSIFTPIDDSRSLLAQHWGYGKTTTEPKPEFKREKDTQIEQTPASKPTPPSNAKSETPTPKRTSSMDFQPPSGTNSAQVNAKRPRLKVQIPEEQSDADSATGESSPRQSGNAASDTPAKTSTEASHSSGTGVVLPPPSPSASAILSAGASGPPNPFARPHPPGGPPQNPSYSSSNNNNIETPISALPSRFVADGLLPSPSSFYPEWGFGRSGGDSNLLPSPLNFQTPVMGGSSFRDEDGDRKRKSPEGGEGQEGVKRVKT